MFSKAIGKVQNGFVGSFLKGNLYLARAKTICQALILIRFLVHF